MPLVLIIEDNPWNARLLSDILQSAAYQILEAHDGATGIAMASRNHPDFILLDMMLPDMNGVDVVKQMRATSTLAHIPILALTANANNNLRHEGLAAGCSDYMVKPFSKQELLEKINSLLTAAK